MDVSWVFSLIHRLPRGVVASRAPVAELPGILPSHSPQRPPPALAVDAKTGHEERRGKGYRESRRRRNRRRSRSRRRRSRREQEKEQEEEEEQQEQEEELEEEEKQEEQEQEEKTGQEERRWGITELQPVLSRSCQLLFLRLLSWRRVDGVCLFVLFCF